MEEPKIEDKPTYCSAWVSKISDQVMCNSLPCCGFSYHGRTDVVTNGFMFTLDKNCKLQPNPDKLKQIGRHALVNGKFVFDDGTIHVPKK